MTLSLFLLSKELYSSSFTKQNSNQTKVQRSGGLPFPSRAAIKMVDKNLQDFELAALDELAELAALVNGEASKNKTKNNQDTLSNRCNQCDFASSQVGQLRIHLRTHSGEKPNKCTQCGYASSDASNLRRHLKKHS